MKTFILMTKLSAGDAHIVEVSSKLKGRARSGNTWLEEIQKVCPEIKFKAHYALMGYWDSMHIYDAPDEEVAAKVSLCARAQGAALVESWLAIPYDRIVKLSAEIKCTDDDL